MKKAITTALAASVIALGAAGLMSPSMAVAANIGAANTSIEETASVSIPSLSLRVGEQKAVTATFANLGGDLYRKIKMPLGLRVIATSTPGMTVFPDANNVAGHPGGNTVEFVVEAVAEASTNTAGVSLAGGNVIGDWEAQVTATTVSPFSIHVHAIDETDGTVTVYGTGTIWQNPSRPASREWIWDVLYLDGKQIWLPAADFLFQGSGYQVRSWSATLRSITPGPHTLTYFDDFNSTDAPFSMGAGSAVRDVTGHVDTVDQATGLATISGTASPGELLYVNVYHDYDPDTVDITADNTGSWTVTVGLVPNKETLVQVVTADPQMRGIRRTSIYAPALGAE